MKRLLVLGTIVAVALVVLAGGIIAQQAGQGAGGQGRGGGAGLGPIGTIQKVTDRLYMIPGGGGNTADLQGGRGGPGGNFNVIYQELQNK